MIFFFHIQFQLIYVFFQFSFLELFKKQMTMNCILFFFSKTNKTTIVEKNLNEIFDRMLPKIREDIIKNGLDPMSMPDTFLSTTNIVSLFF